MSPRALYRGIAAAEAVTWALLLAGMFVKYGTDSGSEVGVKVAGPIHGAVFLAFCVATVVVAVDQRWSLKNVVLGLLSAVPPFVTIAFERYAEKRDLLDSRWRLRTDQPSGGLERLTAWLVRKPLQGLAVGATAVAGLFAVAMIAGPPV